MRDIDKSKEQLLDELKKLRRENRKLKKLGTEYKRLENEIRKNEEVYRAILWAIPDMMFRIKSDGSFTHYKAPKENLYTTPTIFLGKKAEDVLPREVAAVTMEAIEKTLSEGSMQVYEYNLRIGKDLRNFEARMVKCSADSVVCIVRDITDRKKTEEEIFRLTFNLEQSVEERTKQLESANEELKAFAYAVSHDLTAPLRTVFGFACILQEDYGNKLDEEAKGHIQKIVRAAQKMDALIRDLSVFGKIHGSDIDLKKVDMNQAVEDAKDMLRGNIEDRDAEITTEGSLPQVYGHHVTTVQVVQNIIANAVKYTEKDKKPKIGIRAEKRQGKHRIWFKDNGIGIAEEDQDRIFRLFERLHGDKEFQGTGIGLAIVARGMMRMKGRYGVNSRPGKGSSFWIEFLPAR